MNARAGVHLSALHRENGRMDGQASNADNAERRGEASPAQVEKRMDTSHTLADSSLKEKHATPAMAATRATDCGSRVERVTERIGENWPPR
jgi:hypothetical protein